MARAHTPSSNLKKRTFSSTFIPSRREATPCSSFICLWFSCQGGTLRSWQHFFYLFIMFPVRKLFRPMHLQYLHIHCYLCICCWWCLCICVCWCLSICSWRFLLLLMMFVVSGDALLKMMLVVVVVAYLFFYACWSVSWYCGLFLWLPWDQRVFLVTDFLD